MSIIKFFILYIAYFFKTFLKSNYDLLYSNSITIILIMVKSPKKFLFIKFQIMMVIFHFF